MFYKQQQTVNNRLVLKRKAAHLTQQELAELVGVTRQTIIAMEKGNYVPSVMLALKLAVVLTTSVEELFWL